MEIPTNDYIFIILMIMILLLTIFLSIIIVIINNKIYSIWISLQHRINEEGSSKLNLYQNENNKIIRDLREKISIILNKLEKLMENIDNSNKLLEGLNNSKINVPTNFSINSVGESEIIYLSSKNKKLLKIDEEEFFKLKKTKEGRYFLYISDNILKKKPTPEFDIIIQDFYNLEIYPNSKRYKLIEPTELEFYDESTGEYKIKRKGMITYE